MNRTKRVYNISENIISLFFTVCGFIAVFLVVIITGFLFVSGIPAIREIGIKEFILGKVWASASDNPSYGILPFILTSVYGTIGAVVIGVPVGLMCAVFLATKAPSKVAFVVRGAVELLSGIPSVVYGLVGMIVIVPFVRRFFDIPDGANLFSAIIVLAIMILPSVISVSETAIRSVPKEYTEGSLALGATDTETIFKVIFPAARSGVVSAVILGIGRAIGEAMAVMMVAGNVANMPSIFKSVRFLTTAIASEMAYSSGFQREALFSIALVLFVFILIINFILGFIVKRKKEQNK